MAQIHIETEVNATPKEVRAVIFDFPRLPDWHDSFMQSIATIPPTKDPYTLHPGDALDVKIGGVKLVTTLLVNTPTELRWKGSTFAGAFAGEHYFRFLDSKITPNGTTFVHGEDYTGWLTFLFGEGKLGFARGKVAEGYRQVALDAKRRTEDLKAGRKAQGDALGKI